MSNTLPPCGIEPSGWNSVCCPDAVTNFEFVEFQIPQGQTLITIPFQLPKLNDKFYPIGDYIENTIDDSQVVPSFNVVGKTQFSLDLLLSAPVDSDNYFYRGYWGDLGATPCQNPPVMAALEYIEFNIPPGELVITIPFARAKVPESLIPVGVFIENIINDPQIVLRWNIVEKQAFEVSLLLSAPVDSGNYWIKGSWSNVPLI